MNQKAYTQPLIEENPQKKKNTMLKRIGLLLALPFIFQFNYCQKPNDTEYLFNDISENNITNVNQLLTEILDGVGLYTILGDLKPISTVSTKAPF